MMMKIKRARRDENVLSVLLLKSMALLEKAEVVELLKPGSISRHLPHPATSGELFSSFHSNRFLLFHHS